MEEALLKKRGGSFGVAQVAVIEGIEWLRL
jgi:hypothetical protein